MVTYSTVIQLPDTASGTARAWNLIKKLGEGDAGEVYRVQSLLDGRDAILKRPRRAGFPSDSIRQANQIEKEGRVLAVLNATSSAQTAGFTPILLDQSKPGTEFSDRYFIIISIAQGISFEVLARSALLGSSTSPAGGDGDPALTSPEFQLLLDTVIRLRRIPDLLLLRMLSCLIDFLEAAHSLQADTSSGPVYGIIWNDIKPDHIFWDPRSQKFTFIDWGNAQFLDSDGITKDRLYSRMDDFEQMLKDLGEFLSNANPDLHRRLSWPSSLSRGEIYTEGILPLRERVRELLLEETTELEALRQEEAELLLDQPADIERFNRLRVIQDRIAAVGDLPDQANGSRFFVELCRYLINTDQFPVIIEFLDSPNFRLAQTDAEMCLLTRLAHYVHQNNLPTAIFINAISGDWLTTLWEFRRTEHTQVSDTGFDEISESLREHLAGGPVARPLIAINRLVHALKASSLAVQEDNCYEQLLQRLTEEIQPRWRQEEPDPPNSGIDYREIEPLYQEILDLQPEAGKALIQALEQPRLQSALVLDAWERKDLDAARRSLRQLLLWDPDRSRLFQADRALQASIEFLGELTAGLQADEPLYDFITRQELIARELRNQIGPAGWLDDLLQAFKQLRKGAEPTDVLIEHSDLRTELGWLVTLEPRRPLLATPGKSISLARLPQSVPQSPPVLGMRESSIGPMGGIRFIQPLDTWVPEARGSSARAFRAEVETASGDIRSVALKLMRPDRREYSLPLFFEEVRILAILRDVPGVVPMLECGFLSFDGDGFPSGDRPVSNEALSGKVIRFGPDSVHNFLNDLEKRSSSGWIPYIGLEIHDYRNNLLLLCDSGHTNGRFMPIIEGLIITQQICDILDVAHGRDIVYRDHKILHYYWQESTNGVYLMDWNIARRNPGGLSPAEIRFDLVQLAARTLHVIFTGRAAPGALPVGPHRPEDIEAAEASYSPQWIYDDQRLPRDLKDLIEKALAGEYSSARELRDEANSIYTKLAELI